MSVTTAPDVAVAWSTRASELAEWAMKHLVNRTDAYGVYAADGSSYTAKEALVIAALVIHFSGKKTIGLHAVGQDNMCRFVGWDIDLHGPPDAKHAAENLVKAVALYRKLEELRMYPLLEDSNGKGGYHVWVLFDRPRHARDVRAWAMALAPEGWEVFPKQNGVASEPGKGHYGNYIRLFARHHKRPHWSRFWIANEWFEGDDAIDLILGWTPSDTDVIPEVPDEPAVSAAPNQAAADPIAMIDALRHLKRLSPVRADDYDDWLKVGMILHDIDSSPIALAAWDAWSQQSSKYVPGECAGKWETFDGGAYAANNNGRRLGIGTLIKMANHDIGREPVEGVITGTEGNLIPTAVNLASEAPPPHPPDSLRQEGPHGIVLVVTNVDKTPKKLNVRFEVTVDSVATEMDITSSDSSSGLRSAWEQLQEICEAVNKALEPDAAREVKTWLKTLLSRKKLVAFHGVLQRAEAMDRASRTKRDDRPTMQAVATQFMREHLDLCYAVADPSGAWSERLGIVLRQSDFCNRVEPELLERIKGTIDYAAPTDNDPTKPIKHVQQVLKPAWCAITADLPREVNADLGPDSKAARQFRQHIERVWLAPETWIKVEEPGQPSHVERMSLASRVRELVHQARLRSPRWDRVLKGVNAFYRVERNESNEPVVWLGMRVDLCRGEIKGCTIPGLDNQHDLAIVANRYGLADTTGVTPFITDDSQRRRVIVLSRALCDYLIDCVDEVENPALRSAENEGATHIAEGVRIDTNTGEVLDAA